MYRWTPSKSARREFAQKMCEIEKFCEDHHIDTSRSKDSYYFEVRGQKYRVSNHTVEASNDAAFQEDWFTGETVQTRPLYHDGGRAADTIYIHAGKTRIIDIYNDLQAGYELDGRGNHKQPKKEAAAKEATRETDEGTSRPVVGKSEAEEKGLPKKARDDYER